MRQLKSVFSSTPQKSQTNFNFFLDTTGIGLVLQYRDCLNDSLDVM